MLFFCNLSLYTHILYLYFVLAQQRALAAHFIQVAVIKGIKIGESVFHTSVQKPGFHFGKPA